MAKPMSLINHERIWPMKTAMNVLQNTPLKTFQKTGAWLKNSATLLSSLILFTFILVQPLHAKDKKKAKDTQPKLAKALAGLGDYASTAPYDCPKTKKVIALLADHLVSKENELWGATNAGALALLATGEKKYMDVVFNAIKKKLAPSAKEGYLSNKSQRKIIYCTWRWGYEAILLGEYYLLTQDKSALPALKAFALKLARGQDPAGLWGHQLALKETRRAPGYGQMNQVSLSCFLGLVMAKKCGIEEPQIDEAIERTRKYVKLYAWRGSFPYGFHWPQKGSYNNNGTSGSAAMAMSLLGDEKATTYFSQTAAAAHNRLGAGHASSFFNPLWTPLGAALSGPEVYQKFHAQAQNFYDNEVRFPEGKGNYGKEGSKVGVNLLMRCVPRKALLITGREANNSIWVKGEKEATKVAMRSKGGLEDKSEEELLALFSSPFPQERKAALNFLVYGHKSPHLKKRKRLDPDAPRFDALRSKLVSMVGSSDASTEARTTAVACLMALGGIRGGAKMQELFSTILRDRNQPMALRVAVVRPLAPKADADLFDDFFSLLLEEKPTDTFERFNYELGHIITDAREARLGKLLDKDASDEEAAAAMVKWEKEFVKDRQKYYACAKKLLAHKHQRARGRGVNMLEGVQIEDFHRIAEELEYVLRDKDTTYHAYHTPGSALGPGIRIYARLRIREGLDHLETNMYAKSGKWGFKVKNFLKTLPKFGGNASPFFEKMIKEHGWLRATYNKKDRFTPPLKALQKQLAEEKNPPTLISFEEAKAMGRK